MLDAACADQGFCSYTSHRWIAAVQDLHGMIDAAKYADLVLLMVDGGFGFEMETFEFLNLLQVCIMQLSILTATSSHVPLSLCMVFLSMCMGIYQESMPDRCSTVQHLQMHVTPRLPVSMHVMPKTMWLRHQLHVDKIHTSTTYTGARTVPESCFDMLCD